MKIVADIGLFVGLVFAAVTAIVLYPWNPGKVMVVLPYGAESSAVYNLLEGTEGRVVKVMAADRFVVESTKENFIDRLYANGAFLVLNASPILGCEVLDKRKKIPGKTLS